MLIKDKIKNRDHFTSSENQIATYLCNHSKEVLEMSLDELSNTLYVSKSTIIRFCKKLGFSGHKELCVQLAKEFNTFYLNDSSAGTTVLIEKGDTSSEVAQKVYSLCYHAITSVYNELDYKALEEAAELLSMHGRVRLFAMGDDFLPAVKISAELGFCGLDTSVSSVPGLQETDAALMNLRMCALLISSGNNCAALLKTAEILHERMIPVILITGSKKTALQSLATVTISVPINNEGNSVLLGKWMGMMMVSEILGSLVLQKNYDNNMETAEHVRDMLQNRR